MRPSRSMFTLFPFVFVRESDTFDGSGHDNRWNAASGTVEEEEAAPYPDLQQQMRRLDMQQQKKKSAQYS